MPAAHRLRESADFQRVTRQGRRAGSRTLVAHLAPGESGVAVGLVVSKQVGGAVVRNRVKRRLRHAASARLDQLPAGSRLVVRALPASAAASYEELGTDLDRCLQQVTQQRAPR
nr:ribonuclease P protein component [Nocardioides thalensis]